MPLEDANGSRMCLVKFGIVKKIINVFFKTPLSALFQIVS